MAECAPPTKKKRKSLPTTAEEHEEKPRDSSANNSKDCTPLSNNIRIFLNKRMSKHALVFEGEHISGVYGTLPVVIKLVTPVELGIAEARILLKLNQNPHSNIISMIHSDKYSDGFSDYAYIALEKCHSDTIQQFMVSRKDQKIPFDLELALKFCKQLNCGVEYIHEKNIIHKDLKPDNVFLSLDQTRIKIGDFGLSQEIQFISEKVPNSGHFGTDGYRALETFDGAVISQKTDIFSLGIVLYFILSYGEHPFGSDSEIWNLNVKNNTGIELSHLLVRNISTTQHLIKCMIEHELDCRPTIWEVISHPCWTGEEKKCNFGYRSKDSPLPTQCTPSSDAREKLPPEDCVQWLKLLKVMKQQGLIEKDLESDAEDLVQSDPSTTSDQGSHLGLDKDVESDELASTSVQHGSGGPEVQLTNAELAVTRGQWKEAIKFLDHARTIFEAEELETAQDLVEMAQIALTRNRRIQAILLYACASSQFRQDLTVKQASFNTGMCIFKIYIIAKDALYDILTREERVGDVYYKDIVEKFVLPVISTEYQVLRAYQKEKSLGVVEAGYNNAYISSWISVLLNIVGHFGACAVFAKTNRENVKAILKEKCDASQSFARLLQEEGHARSRLGQYDEARKLLLNALEVKEKSLMSDPERKNRAVQVVQGLLMKNERERLNPIQDHYYLTFV